MPKTTRTASTRTVKKRSASPASSPSSSPPPSSDPSWPPSHAVRMRYRIGRGEEGVLAFEPYKSHLLPHWRFATPDKARESSKRLWEEFEQFAKRDDFVGMDMTRKFLQMGMTRATRYANRAGGRKYDKATGNLLPKSTGHPGQADKLESAAIFREAWERAKAHEGYQAARKVWERGKKEWEKEHGKVGAEPAKKRRKKEDGEASSVKKEKDVKAEKEEE
ncbi:hypothetical protein JCM8097_007491 [Rhodosporidiobolus ruineniae]